MAVYQELIDYSEMLAHVPNPIFIGTKTDDGLSDELEQHIEGHVSLVPQCYCGQLKGEIRKGLTCGRCGQEVVSPMDIKLPYLWMRSLDGYRGFINPAFWIQVSGLVSQSYDVLRWICDPRYKDPTHVTPKRVIMILKGIPSLKRSYKWLEENILTVLITLKNSLPTKREKFDEYISMYKDNEDLIFTKVLPIPNKGMVIVERDYKGKSAYVDPLTAVHDIVNGYVTRLNSKKDYVLDALMAHSTFKSAYSSKVFIRDYLSGKYKLVRQHIYGTRVYFTARGTIVPLVGEHRHDEIVPSWSIMVTLFRPHLLNKLRRKGMFYKDAKKLLITHVHRSHSLIEECLDELISESPYSGIPAGFQRNPTLLPGSWVSVFIRRYNKDPNIKTIGMSDLITSLFNADFDGDQMHIMLYLDNAMAREMEAFRAYHSALDFDKVGEVSGLISLGKPLVSNISSVIAQERGQ